jgi:hypothetical protein
MSWPAPLVPPNDPRAGDADNPRAPVFLLESRSSLRGPGSTDAIWLTVVRCEVAAWVKALRVDLPHLPHAAQLEVNRQVKVPNSPSSDLPSAHSRSTLSRSRTTFCPRRRRPCRLPGRRAWCYPRRRFATPWFLMPMTRCCRSANFARRVAMVFLIGDGGVVLFLRFIIHYGYALGQANAAIARHLLEVRQAAECRGPAFAGAVVGQAASDPAQAVLFHHHRAGPAAEGKPRRRRPARRSRAVVDGRQQRGGVDPAP